MGMVIKGLPGRTLVIMIRTKPNDTRALGEHETVSWSQDLSLRVHYFLPKCLLRESQLPFQGLSFLVCGMGVEVGILRLSQVVVLCWWRCHVWVCREALADVLENLVGPIS